MAKITGVLDKIPTKLSYYGEFLMEDGTIISDFFQGSDGVWMSGSRNGHWNGEGGSMTPGVPSVLHQVIAPGREEISSAMLAAASAKMADQREEFGSGLGPLPAEGVKFDADKLPYHLIAPELLSSVADILAFGAKKYSARNWEKGMAWHRPFRACIGHLWDWWRGAGPDEETGKSHLWHAACCIMFLVAYEARGIGEDDRPR